MSSLAFGPGRANAQAHCTPSLGRHDILQQESVTQQLRTTPQATWQAPALGGSAPRKRLL